MNEMRIVSATGHVIASVRVGEGKTHFLSDPAVAAPKQEAYDYELYYKQVEPILQFLDYSQQETAVVFEVNASTLSRWKKEDKSIGRLRSKTMYDIDSVIAKGIRIFGSEDRLKEWLNTTNYALGDKKPVDMLKDPYGVALVNNALEAISWGNVM